MQLRLTIESGTLAGHEFTLESGFLTIGRGDQCSIRFDPLSERIASKQHAYINAQPDGFYITDNQSTNGTLLNRNRIETARLSDGDIVQFGKNGVRARVSIDAVPNIAAPVSVGDGYDEEQPAPFDMSDVAPSKSVQLSISQLGLGGIQRALVEGGVGADRQRNHADKAGDQSDRTTGDVELPNIHHGSSWSSSKRAGDQ